MDSTGTQTVPYRGYDLAQAARLLLSQTESEDFRSAAPEAIGSELRVNPTE